MNPEENKMLTEPGESLTQEIQQGIEESKGEGFKYRKSPTEMFSMVDECESNLSKLEQLVADKLNKKKESELQTYSNITSFDQLLEEIPKVIKSAVITHAGAKAEINVWLDDFNSVDSEEGLNRALSDLHTALTSTSMDQDEFIALAYQINELLTSYYNNTGKLFYFCATAGFSSSPIATSESISMEVSNTQDEPGKVETPKTVDLALTSVIDRLTELGFQQNEGEPDFTKTNDKGSATVTVSPESIHGVVNIFGEGESNFDTTDSTKAIELINNLNERLETEVKAEEPKKPEETQVPETKNNLASYSNRRKHSKSKTEPDKNSYSNFLTRMATRR